MIGVGEVVGALSHGVIIDRIGLKKTIYINIFIGLLVCSFTEITLFSGKYNFFTFATCFLWGYQDGTAETFISALLGHEFRSADSFAVFAIL